MEVELLVHSVGPVSVWSAYHLPLSSSPLSGEVLLSPVDLPWRDNFSRPLLEVSIGSKVQKGRPFEAWMESVPRSRTGRVMTLYKAYARIQLEYCSARHPQRIEDLGIIKGVQKGFVQDFQSE